MRTYLLSSQYRSLLFVLIFVLGGGLTACSDDSSSGGDLGPGDCAVGERFNEVNGKCEPTRGGNHNNDPSDAGDDAASDVDDDVFVPPDTDYDPDAANQVDVDDDDRCTPGIDSDDDGLTNECECRLGTDPSNSDTDGDGVPDGEEDANQNCRFDPGESDPRTADTDGDGLDDGQERVNGTDFLDPDTDGDGVPDGAEVDSGCMDPRSEHSDDDGIPDGVEDTNGDGEIGTCPDRNYDPSCANGESDPCSNDTDGDGTPDNDEVQYLDCRPEDTQNLTQPQLITSNGGDYQLAVPNALDTAQVSGLNGPAHVFNDGTNDFAGFIAAISGSQSTVEATRDEIVGQVTSLYSGSVRRSTGRRITTHDGYSAAVGAVVELADVTNISEARDDILGALGSGTASHSLSSSFPSGSSSDPLLFVFEAVQRSGSDYVLSAAVVRESDFEDDTAATGYLIADITGGAAIAEASETLTEQCVSYRVNTNPEVDFIWVIDGSGSMNEEISQVRAFADDFVQILQASNLDWRLGVTTGSCDGIEDDTAISQEVSSIFGSGWDSSCPSLPSFPGISFSPYSNGKLCDHNNANFTRDPQKFKDCVQTVADDESGEHTVSMGLAAIDRALPRTPGDPVKIREDAAVVVISVTDEFDEYVQSEMGWPEAGDGSNPPQDPTTDPNFDSAGLDQVIQPLTDYYLRPEVGATVFGIHWIPGEQCSTAAEAAVGIQRVVNTTGGTSGSICQSDLTATLSEIADASAGIASGLRLRGTPAPPSVDVNIGQVSSGTIVDWPRGRDDGWDYDSIVNRVTFQGPNPPQTGDRVVIPYLRWDGSIQQCTDDTDCPSEQKLRCVDGVCL